MEERKKKIFRGSQRTRYRSALGLFFECAFLFLRTGNGLTEAGTLPPAEKLLLSIAEVCALTGLSRTTIYQLIGSGQLKSKSILTGKKGSKQERGRRMIPRAALEAFCRK